MAVSERVSYRCARTSSCTNETVLNLTNANRGYKYTTAKGMGTCRTVVTIHKLISFVFTYCSLSRKIGSCLIFEKQASFDDFVNILQVVSFLFFLLCTVLMVQIYTFILVFEAKVFFA